MGSDLICYFFSVPSLQVTRLCSLEHLIEDYRVFISKVLNSYQMIHTLDMWERATTVYAERMHWARLQVSENQKDCVALVAPPLELENLGGLHSTSLSPSQVVYTLMLLIYDLSSFCPKFRAFVTRIRLISEDIDHELVFDIYFAHVGG